MRRTQGKKVHSWHLNSVLRSFDIFGQQLPTFNLKGQSTVHTMAGGVITFFILVVTLVYASIKMVQLFDRHNPTVSQVLDKNVFDYNEKINLNEIGYRVAFSVEGYHSREMKDDPRYVKYLVRIFGKKEGVEYEKFIPYDKCTEEDWAEFPPPAQASADSWNDIKSGEKRGMFCLDWSEDIFIYGNEKNEEYQRIELVLTPCNYLHTHLGYKNDTVHPDCVADLEKQIEYLGPLDFMLYHTEQVFI